MKKIVGFMVVILVMMIASSPPIKARENNTAAKVPEESVFSLEAETNFWHGKNSELATGGAMIKICDVVSDLSKTSWHDDGKKLQPEGLYQRIWLIPSTTYLVRRT